MSARSKRVQVEQLNLGMQLVVKLRIPISIYKFMKRLHPSNFWNKCRKPSSTIDFTTCT